MTGKKNYRDGGCQETESTDQPEIIEGGPDDSYRLQEDLDRQNELELEDKHYDTMAEVIQEYADQGMER